MDVRSGRSQAAPVTVIRAEACEDALGIGALLEASFGSRQVPGLVEMIRKSPEYEPDLALVAEDDTGLVGFVLFSRLPLLSPAGRWWSVLVLSPLAVRPDRVGEGIGSALTRDGLARADHRGEALVVLEGDPGYYARFGASRGRLPGGSSDRARSSRRQPSNCAPWRRTTLR